MSAVSEILPSRKVVTIGTLFTPSALDAAKLMIKERVGSVVVLGIDEKPIGILTERDILKKVTAMNKPPKDVAVQDIMSSPLVTIRSYSSIESAAALMADKKIKRLVVLEDDGSIAGVLSVTDITRKLAKILAADYNRYGHLRAILDL
jgi:CBS domain-containing protein